MVAETQTSPTFEDVFGRQRGGLHAAAPAPQQAAAQPTPADAAQPTPAESQVHPLLALTPLLKTAAPESLSQGKLLISAHVVIKRDYQAWIEHTYDRQAGWLRRTAMFSLGTRRADHGHEFVVSYRNRGNEAHSYAYSGPDIDEALRVFNQLTAPDRLRPRRLRWQRVQVLTAADVERATKQLAGYQI